jgi:hypothetical protein
MSNDGNYLESDPCPKITLIAKEQKVGRNTDK